MMVCALLFCMCDVFCLQAFGCLLVIVRCYHHYWFYRSLCYFFVGPTESFCSIPKQGSIHLLKRIKHFLHERITIPIFYNRLKENIVDTFVCCVVFSFFYLIHRKWQNGWYKKYRNDEMINNRKQFFPFQKKKLLKYFCLCFSVFWIHRFTTMKAKSQRYEWLK